MSKYLVFTLEVVFLLGLPILLLTTSSQFLAIRHVFMGIAGIYSCYHLLRSGSTYTSLGLHRAKFQAAVKDLAIPSLLMVGVTYLLFAFLPLDLLTSVIGYDPYSTSSLFIRCLTYITLSAPIQELIFRGYLTWRIKEVFSNRTIIQLISIAIFTFVHLPFHSPLLLVISFFMGLIYIKNYQNYDNLYAPIVSHALVGMCLILIRNAWFPY